MKQMLSRWNERLALKKNQREALMLSKKDPKQKVICYTFGPCVLLVSRFATYKDISTALNSLKTEARITMKALKEKDKAEVRQRMEYRRRGFTDGIE